MSNLNNYCCKGNLVSDPSLKILPNSDKSICRYRIAINTAYKKKDNDDTIFMSVVTFGKLAEVCAEYLKKGQAIIVSGKLKPNNWVTKDGQKRNEIELHASDIDFVSRNKNNSGNNNQTEQEDQTFDDIPF